MITDIEDFFTKGCGRCPRFETAACSTRRWSRGLQSLRSLCLGQGLDESLKWGQPCYRHAGRNLVIFGALRADFRLSFFDGALLKDPQGLLHKNGPNSPQADTLRFVHNDEPAQQAEWIRAYIEEAKGYAEAGLRAPKPAQDLTWPEALVEAMDADPELAQAFHALTPGRQKSYVLALNAAKKPETRVARLLKFRDKILAGKGAQEY